MLERSTLRPSAVRLKGVRPLHNRQTGLGEQHYCAAGLASRVT